MLRKMLGVVALACLLAAPAAAEIFRYTDDKGTVHFVSSESQIPPRYRNRAGRAAGGSVGRVDDEVVESPAQSISTRNRLEKLRKQNQSRKPPAASPSRSSVRPKGVRDPGKEPRKYIKDCNIRNANGRCGRRRSPEWDAWNREKLRYEASQRQP